MMTFSLPSLSTMERPLLEIILMGDILRILEGQDGIVISIRKKNSNLIHEGIPQCWVDATFSCIYYAKTILLIKNLLGSHPVDGYSQKIVSFARQKFREFKMVVHHLQDLFRQQQLGFSQLAFHLEAHFPCILVLAKMLESIDNQNIMSEASYEFINSMAGDVSAKVTNERLLLHQKYFLEKIIRSWECNHYDFLKDILEQEKEMASIDCFKKLSKVLWLSNCRYYRQRLNLSPISLSPIVLAALNEEACRRIHQQILPKISDISEILNQIRLVKDFYSLQNCSLLDQFICGCWKELLSHTHDPQSLDIRSIVSTWERVKCNPPNDILCPISISVGNPPILEQIRHLYAANSFGGVNQTLGDIAPRAVDSICFHFNPLQKLDAIWDASSLQKYELFFRFLLKLFSLEKALQTMALRRPTKPFLVLRNFAQSILRGFHQYFISDVLAIVWISFAEQALLQAKSLDDVKEHHTRFLNTILRNSLMDNPHFMYALYKLFDVISELPLCRSDNASEVARLDLACVEGLKSVLDLLRYLSTKEGNYNLAFLLARITRA